MSRRRLELVVAMPAPIVVSDDRHCHNDCEQMRRISSWGESGYVFRCELFKHEMQWDKRCKKHGYLRHPECIRRAQYSAEVEL